MKRYGPPIPFFFYQSKLFHYQFLGPQCPMIYPASTPVYRHAERYSVVGGSPMGVRPSALNNMVNVGRWSLIELSQALGLIDVIR